MSILEKWIADVVVTITLFFYAFTSLIAGVVGVALALLIRPGKEAIGLSSAGVEVEIVEINIIENIVDWVPSNPN